MAIIEKHGIWEDAFISKKISLEKQKINLNKILTLGFYGDRGQNIKTSISRY